MQRYSQLYTKTKRQAPSDEVSVNSKYLIRGGYINKELSGAYSYLPLGLKTLNKIINIIRDEMNKIGAQEVLLTSLQDPKTWQASNRWGDDVIDVWFKTKLHSGSDLGLANTHEEAMAKLMTNFVESYKDLPAYIYQFQTKFRNEPRAKSGILRTREFIMKDLYSFNKSQQELNEFYEKAKQAYVNVFNRVGIGNITYLTFASGGAFSKYSHEFQTLAKAGEDTVYVDKNKKIAINKEVYTDEVIKDLGLNKNDLVEQQAIEVGNIFKLGTRFSKALNLKFTNEEGKEEFVEMGSYGIGPGRLMGTIVETNNDESGIIWPTSVAPYHIYFVTIGNYKQQQQLIKQLEQLGYEVLLDDSNSTVGEKFANADLLGLPVRVVLSEKSLKAGGLEVKKRSEKDVKIVKESEFAKYIQTILPLNESKTT